MHDACQNPTSHNSKSSYDSKFFAHLFESEDQHFWFCTRNQLIAELIGQLTASLPAGYRILELGCGTGNVLRALQQNRVSGSVVGLDLYREGLRYASMRTPCPLVQADLYRLPFRASFDIVGIFDVLEHLPDDIQVLTDLHCILKPGGTLLLTVPAHQSLWSYFDDASRHCRRYELADLRDKLLATNYEVDYITYYNASLFPLVWVGRRLATWLSKFTKSLRHKEKDIREMVVHELQIVPIMNQVLTFILTQENRLLAQRHDVPIGTSLLAIARKMPPDNTEEIA